MPTTYTLPFTLTGASEPLTITTIDRANFGPGIPSVVDRGGSETTYRYVSGNPSRPTTLRVGHYPPSKAGATTNDSVKLRATGVKTDGDGVESEFPVEVTIATADGSHGQLDRADIAAMLMIAFTVYVMPVGEADEPSESALERLSFGVTDILGTTFAEPV